MREMHTVVVPMYREQEVVPLFMERMLPVLDGLGDCELIVVDDGSDDRTFDVLSEYAERDTRIKVVRFARNFGHQAAITAGMTFSCGDTVTVIDADLQDPPEVILELVRAWREGADIVYAVRATRKGESAFKLATARVYYRMLAMMTPNPAPLDSGDFRLMSRAAVDAFLLMGEHNRYVRGMVGWIGMPEARVVYERQARAAGETKYPLRKMIKLGLDGVISSSTVPLRLATWLGAAAALLGFLIAGWAFIQRLTGHEVVRGWTSMMVALLFIGGVQLLTLGIIGEYIGRIYDEVRSRPLYLIKETRGLASPEVQQ